MKYSLFDMASRQDGVQNPGKTSTATSTANKRSEEECIRDQTLLEFY